MFAAILAGRRQGAGVPIQVFGKPLIVKGFRVTVQRVRRLARKSQYRPPSPEVLT